MTEETKSCDCANKVDKFLRDKNTRLSRAFVFSSGMPERLMVTTETLEKKRGAKPVKMFPSFCPFCGRDLHEGK